MEYLPFGELLVDEHLNSINLPFKFNGKMLDGETGNYYYGARYYDPKLSVWLSVDPLAEQAPGWSPYRYGFNNPVRYTDPTGMFEDDYEIDGNGKISLLKRTDSKNDRLLAQNGDVIDDNVQKGILGDNMELGKHVNLINMNYTNENGENLDLGEINDVLFRTSLYFQKEIAWGKFESSSDKLGWVAINPFINNSDVEATGVGSHFRRNGELYTLTEDYHTHPSWRSGGGYPSGAGGDIRSLGYNPKGTKAFIISRQAYLTRYDNQVPNQFNPPMKRREEWISKEFVKKQWGWKKSF